MMKQNTASPASKPAVTVPQTDLTDGAVAEVVSSAPVVGIGRGMQRLGSELGIGVYALVSPLRNEAAHLPRLIDSVLGQTVRPRTWVIVDDGSTDRTADIATECARQHDFIRLVSLPAAGGRDFASKVRAFRVGVEHVDLRALGFVGNLDGDVSLPPDYYQRLVVEFQADSALGIVGGGVLEALDGVFRPRTENRESDVAGAAMLFRVACYVQVGGYRPLACGGEDTAVQYAARRHGWAVKTVSDLAVFHHRPPNPGLRSAWRAATRNGTQDAVLGYSLLYFAGKVARRTQRLRHAAIVPAWFIGYALGMLQLGRYQYPHGLRVYTRRAQRAQLADLLRRAIGATDAR